MSHFDTPLLIEELHKDVRNIIATIKELAELGNATLYKQPDAGKWSIAQIIEHLNSYNRYYLPEIKNALQNGLNRKILFNATYNSGWLGNYFTKMMMPKENGKVANKMNAPKDHQPTNDLDVKKVVGEFMAGEIALLNYLEQARKTNMGRLRVPISISKFIKLKLGDTFRFLIAHQQRHFVQVANTLKIVAPKRQVS